MYQRVFQLKFGFEVCGCRLVLSFLRVFRADFRSVLVAFYGHLSDKRAELPGFRTVPLTFRIVLLTVRVVPLAGRGELPRCRVVLLGVRVV